MGANVSLQTQRKVRGNRLSGDTQPVDHGAGFHPVET